MSAILTSYTLSSLLISVDSEGHRSALGHTWTNLLPLLAVPLIVKMLCLRHSPAPLGQNRLLFLFFPSLRENLVRRLRKPNNISQPGKVSGIFFPALALSSIGVGRDKWNRGGFEAALFFFRKVLPLPSPFNLPMPSAGGLPCVCFSVYQWDRRTCQHRRVKRLRFLGLSGLLLQYALSRASPPFFFFF